MFDSLRWLFLATQYGILSHTVSRSSLPGSRPPYQRPYKRPSTWETVALSPLRPYIFLASHLRNSITSQTLTGFHRRHKLHPECPPSEREPVNIHRSQRLSRRKALLAIRRILSRTRSLLSLSLGKTLPALEEIISKVLCLQRLSQIGGRTSQYSARLTLSLTICS